MVVEDVNMHGVGVEDVSETVGPEIHKYSMQLGKSVINLIPVKYWHKNSLSEFALASFQPPGVLKLMVTCFWFPPLGCPEDQAVNFNFVPSLQNHLLFSS